MKKKDPVRIVFSAVKILGLALFILGLLWFMSGSMETFPTAEQTEKARIGALLVMAAGGAAFIAGGVLHRTTVGGSDGR